MTIKKYTHLILIALCVFSLSCASMAFAWGSGNEFTNAVEHANGHISLYESYTMPPYQPPSSGNTYNYTPPQPGYNYNAPVKRNGNSRANSKGNANAQATASTAHLPPIREIQKNFRTMFAAQGITRVDDLKDKSFAWVFDDDLDAVKVLLRENKNNAWLAFREQTEPWYKDNPYCVGAISGFSQFDENTFVWAPPTMEEHIRAFFKLKCSDAALQRLCEAQFITNYNVLHYKVFCSRLMKIQGQAKGKDATALITAYAKELEAKGPKVFQEREAWRGEPFDVAKCETGIEYSQNRFSRAGWNFDPQTLKNTNLARFERTNTTGQDVTLERCLTMVRGQNMLLKTSGMKYDINKSLQNLTYWLKHAKCQVPCSQYIWKYGS